MLITDLKQGVKNPNRVNVFVDGRFSFSLDLAQVVDLGVKIGQEISDVDLVEFKKASEFGKLYQRALEKALTRPHSEREMRDYLMRKLMRVSLETSRLHAMGSSTSEDMARFSYDIISRLTAKGYLDDRKFAEYYVENRFVKKGVSRRRLEMELMKKGVAKEIIGEVLGERNDVDEIRKVIKRKRGKYDDEKLKAYLLGQGFSYDLVCEVVDEDWSTSAGT